MCECAGAYTPPPPPPEPPPKFQPRPTPMPAPQSVAAPPHYLRVVPVCEQSRESWQTYKQKLAARKARGAPRLIMPEVNGFLGDEKYWEAVG